MIADIQIMKDQIAGFIEKGKGLREEEAVHLKLQGINEEIEQAVQDKDKAAGEIEVLKTDIKALKAQKNESLKGVVAEIAEKMNTVLPVGEAVLSLEDGVFFGWNYSGIVIPYDGLSGGQAQIFNSALAYAMVANILVVEAGELDANHLQATLEELSLLAPQVIVNTCHTLDKIAPKPFQTIVLG